jgi:hypothetical protein
METALRWLPRPVWPRPAGPWGSAAPPPMPARHPRPKGVPRPRPRPALALSDAERAAVLDVLHSERFVDRSPAQVYATLLDEGSYLASERTMYRVLAANDEVRERVTSSAIRPTSSPSCWPHGPTSCGAGTSPSSKVRPPGAGSTSTSCSTCSVAAWSAGCWRYGRVGRWPTGSSPRPWPRRPSPAVSPSMPTGAAR